MKNKKFILYALIFGFFVGSSQLAYSAFKTGRIGGARNLVATPVVDLITALNAKLGQVQLSQLLSNPGQWLANSDIEVLNLNLESFGGFPLDQHELAFLTHSLATALSDNSTTLGSSQASLQSLINSSVTNGACRSSNCSETSADWVHGQVSDESFANADNVNLISATLLDDLMSGDSSHVEGYTSIVLGANSAVGIQDLRDDGFFRSISNPSGNQPPPATDIRNAINHIAGFVQPATVGAPTPAEYTAGQTLADNFLNNNDRSNFTLANFISCFNNNEAARSGGQGTCTVTSSEWDQQVTALANFNTAKSTLAGGTPLTVADLQAIPVTFGNLTTPIEEWHADYISSQLGTGDTVSLTDWQNTINSINEGVAARWKIQQVADNATGHEASDVTNHLLARATDGTFDVVTALGAGVSKTAAGFGASSNINGLTSTSTPAQIQSAVLTYIGFTDPIYAAWNGNSDRANFTLADFTACYNNNETQRSGGANACTPTAADWASASSVLTLFAEAKSDVADDQTLSASQLSAIGLDVSRFGATPANWVYEYISESVSATAANISDWQATIDSLDTNRTQASFGLANGYSLPTGLRLGTTQTPGSVTLAFNPNSRATISNASISSSTSSNCSLGLAGTTSVSGQVVPTYPISATAQGNCTLSVVSSAYGYPDYTEDFTFPIWPNAINQTDAVTVSASHEGERRFGQTVTLTPGGGSGTGAFTYTVQSGGCTVSNNGQVTSSSVANCVIRVTKAADQQYNARHKDQRVIFYDQLVDLPKCDLQLASSNGTYNGNTGRPVYSSSIDHYQWAGKTARYVASDGATLQYKVTDLRGDRCDDSFDGVNGIKMWWGWPSQFYCKFRIRKVDSNGIPTTNWSDKFTMVRGSGSFTLTEQAQLTALNPSVEGSREALEASLGAWVKNDGTYKWDTIQGGSGTGSPSIEGATGACTATIPDTTYPTSFRIVGNTSGNKCQVSINKAADTQYAAARTCAEYFVGRPQNIEWSLPEGVLNTVQTYDLNNVTVRRNGSVYNGPIEWFVTGPVFDTPEGPGCSISGTTLTKVYNGRCRITGRVRSDSTFVQDLDWTEIDTKDPNLPCRDTWGKFWTTDGTAAGQTVCTVNRGHAMQCPSGSQPIYDGCVSEMNYCRNLQFTEASGENIRYLYWGWDRGSPGTVRATYSSSTYDDDGHNTKTVRDFGNGYQTGHWAAAHAETATLCAQVSPAFGTNNSFAE